MLVKTYRKPTELIFTADENRRDFAFISQIASTSLYVDYRLLIICSAVIFAVDRCQLVTCKTIPNNSNVKPFRKSQSVFFPDATHVHQIVVFQSVKINSIKRIRQTYEVNMFWRRSQHYICQYSKRKNHTFQSLNWHIRF